MAPNTSFLLHHEERPLPAPLRCRIVVNEAWASASGLQKSIEDWIVRVSQ